MLKPLPAEQWDRDAAAHLLGRAGFGGTPEQIDALHALGLAKAVDHLVNPADGAAGPPPPDWAHPQNVRDLRRRVRQMKDEPAEQRMQRRAMRLEAGENIQDLRRWWLDWLGNTPAPLVEKMTLFWHGHFATSVEKVHDGYWMWRQNDTLRRRALGNFVALCKDISRDPAMMLYLDLPQSKAEHPNENWARELMELFTVGLGRYSEQDVRNSARAFTGYRIDLTDQQFRFAPRQHDAGQKTFLGHRGAFGGDDIINILAQQPACAEFIGHKIWRYFVEDDPAPAVVQAVAERMRAHDYEMRPLLREIFLSEEFYAPGVRRSQIKSPVQFLVQTARLLDTQLPGPLVTQNAMRQMGQILFAPPNVKGWDGGKAWINTSTLLFRYNFANYLINGDAMHANVQPGRKQGGDLGFRGHTLAAELQREPIDVSKFIPAELREKPAELVAHLSRRFFGQKLPAAETETFTRYLASRAPDTSDETMRALLHLMLSTPNYQLI